GRAGPPASAGHHRLRPPRPRCQRRGAAALRRDHRGRAARLAPPGAAAQPDGRPASPAAALRALITGDSPDPAGPGGAQDRIPGPEPARAAEIRRLTPGGYRWCSEGEPPARAAGLPAPLAPLGQVRPLGPERGVLAVAGIDPGAIGQDGEHPLLQVVHELAETLG